MDSEVTCEKFVDKRFGGDAESLIATCVAILDDYERQGYDLSLRQLYYQLVQKNLVPNTEQSYKRVGAVISDARLAGLIDWDMIKDRGREALGNTHWDSPEEVLKVAARSFRTAHWKDQKTYVEVMVEKQALEGVLIPVCERLDVTFTANKGYASSSTLYEAGLRFREELHPSHRTRLVIMYLGDHDPSGIDMTRDVEERVRLFTFGGTDGCDESDFEFEVKRLALNMAQVRRLSLPPNPAKMTDSRATAYVEKFGEHSWELDAIEPSMLADIVTKAVIAERDPDIYADAVASDRKAREDAIEKIAKMFARKK